ncbi:MAG: histidine phosphatase family protein [Burkholderiaceae bacterium]|nr:histidine phosphatase family protein [Burkholderiaceae bacterium]
MKKILSIILLSFCTAIFAWPAQSSPLLNALTDGQHVLMIRHADAPGFSDPPSLKLGDCSTQRNLGERGRTQAKELGVWLKKQGIASAVVLSSAWCRCEETARLLGLGAVTTVPELGSFFQNMSDSGPQTNALKALLAQRLKAPAPSKPMILVTHQVNISAFTGTSVGQGELLLVKIGANGAFVSARSIATPHSD